MKKVSWIVGLCAIMAFQCHKNKLPEHSYIGRIIRVTCASTVIQITSTDSVGQDGWHNALSPDTVYNNVFKASNPCQLPASLKEGAPFSFTLNEPQSDTCVICMMYDAPPEVSYRVENIKLMRDND